jgi:hypothetical protein
MYIIIHDLSLLWRPRFYLRAATFIFKSQWKLKRARGSNSSRCSWSPQQIERLPCLFDSVRRDWAHKPYFDLWIRVPPSSPSPLRPHHASNVIHASPACSTHWNEETSYSKDSCDGGRRKRCCVFQETLYYGIACRVAHWRVHREGCRPPIDTDKESKWNGVAFYVVLVIAASSDERQ